MKRLTKKNLNIAFITGASRGIGSAISQRLAKDGYFVIVGYNKSLVNAKKVVNQIVIDGGRALAFKIDISSYASIKKTFRKISKIGKIKVLVNNAAISQEKPFLNITKLDLDKMLDTNLRGVFFCIQQVLPVMIKQKAGRIINIASIGGQWGGVNQIHYASSKAGVIGLTRSIAKTFSHKGITCNAISPGLVATDMSSRELNTNKGKLKVKSIPIGRIGSLSDIAGTVSFLSSQDGEYITGQTVNLNGGMYFG